jgi:nicotinamidase-related amidase
VGTAARMRGIPNFHGEIMKQALILVDIQNDYFSGGKRVLSNVDAATANAFSVLELARKNGDLVIHVQHVTLAENAPFFAPNTQGVELYAQTKNLPNERVIVKNHLNPFRGTDLAVVLRDNNIDHVVVVGHMSHMCIDAVTRHAVDLGYKTTVIHDACATHDLEFNGVRVPASQVHAAFMASLQFGYAELASAAAFTRDSNAEKAAALSC